MFCTYLIFYLHLLSLPCLLLSYLKINIERQLIRVFKGKAVAGSAQESGFGFIPKAIAPLPVVMGEPEIVGSAPATIAVSITAAPMQLSDRVGLPVSPSRSHFATRVSLA